MSKALLDVLLIEDNAQEANLVRHYLSTNYSENYRVTHAALIEKALEKLSSGFSPGIILLDLHLPDTNDLDGYERISAAVPQVPIIILTNFDDEKTAARAVRLGAQDYLIKKELNAALLKRAIRYGIERWQSEQALRKMQERYALAVAGANDSIWDWQASDDSAYFSPRWNEMLGLDETDVPTSLDSWMQRVHPDDMTELRNAMTPGKVNGSHSYHFENEHRLRRSNGHYVWVHARGVVLTDSDGDAVRMAGSISNIEHRKETENRLVHDAVHDALTGLPNRVLFVDRLTQALKRHSRDQNFRFAVLYFDLDRFKFVNDSLGHSAGDALLVSIARRLISVMRPSDTVARMGGDEFAVLVNDLIDDSDATRVAERIHGLFEQDFSVLGRDMYSSASIGIAIVHDQHQSPEEILRDADLAMYRAKRSESERTIIFDSTMHKAAVKRLTMETDLRRAVERSEFELHYQPIVSLTSGRIVSFEALLRWNHPGRGLLLPDDFLPVAEDTGILQPLTWWILEQACSQLKRWQKLFPMDPPLGVSVNVSAQLFQTSNAAERLLAIIGKNALRPEDLHLELTERDFMDHEAAAHTVCSTARRSGIQIHMDDFGTGYSSLSYLQRCAYDSLKIDKTFVQSIEGESEGHAIIKTIVGLGKILNMNIVAEGVESPQQLEALKLMECPEAQGFLFSRPVPAMEAGQLLKSTLH